MTLLILRFLFKNRFSLPKSKLIHLFLILVAMLISSSASPQQVNADFTTFSATTGCGSLVVEFQDLSTGSPDTWLWDFGNGNSSILQNPTVIYSNPGTYDIKLIASNSSTNDTKVSNGLIKVYENPISEISTGSVISGCVPLEVDFQGSCLSNNVITDWQWDFGDGGSSTIQNPLYEYNNIGNFSVSLLITDINNCQSLSIEPHLVKVDKVAGANFIADITFSCNATELITFTNNTIVPASYIWDFGDGNTSSLENPSHNYLSGVYTTSLFAKIGSCIDTLEQINYIQVGEELYPNFISDISYGCEGMLVNFSDITLNNPDSWFWDFGDGNTSTAQSPTHIYLNPGTYDVTLSVSKLGQCQNSYTINNAITVYEKPVIQIIADTTYSCITPFNVEFNDITVDAISWDWTFGNGLVSSSSNPITLYTNYGSYNIDLTVTNINGCTSTKEFIDFIEVEEISVNIRTSEISGCAPFEIEFTDTTHSTRPLVAWNWSFGDGNFSNIQTPANEYTTVGLFEITLSVINDYGCVAYRDFPNYINSSIAPEVEFEASPIVSCVGSDINFFDLSTSTDSITNWLWDFGNDTTSNLKNPIYQYQLPGLYNVTLIAGINNCKDTLLITDYIKIIEPKAIFIEEYDCDNPLTVQFENLSTGADSVFWDFGDGNTSTLLDPVHSYAFKGVYDVSLYVSNSITGCTNQLIKSIKLTIPQASFDYLINSNNSYKDSVGCIPKQVYVNNTSEDWSWVRFYWSDGSIEYGTHHLFTTEGIFDVTMEITDMHGCKDSSTIEHMYHMYDVDADFGISNILGCDSMFVEFEDLTTPSSTVIWDFGDGGGSSLNNPGYIYFSEGLYDVSIHVESDQGCKDTLARLEYIKFQYPVAEFNSNIQGICPEDIVQFTNLSNGIGINSIWDFGDGTQSIQINPSHSFVGNGLYDISLLITDTFGCSNNILLNQYIEVLKPTANFITAGVSSNCPPLISDFTNLSSPDVNSFTWDFNDGSNSIIENPSHLFTNSGVFNVSLIVENSFGCKDTLVQNGLINIAGPTGSFNISDTLICKNDSIQFFPIVSNTDLYLWDFGNGIVSTDSLPTQIYTNDGVYIPVLIIEDTSGCQFIIKNTDTITVVSVNVEAGIDVEICEGDQVQLNALGNATQFSWSPILSLSNPNISNPIASPITDIMYYIHHSDGMCDAYDSVFIKVNNEVPSPTFSSTQHCEGDTVQFSAYSGLLTNNIAWEWSFGANIQNPLQELNLGINSIELIAINLDNNCSDTTVQEVEIYALPIADFLATEVCYGEQVLFTNNSSVNTVEWIYNFSDGIGTSYDQNPTYIYSEPGVYNVSLNVTSNNGCKDSIIKDVIVHNLPIVDFTIENHCEGEGNIFTDLSSVINGEIESIQYNFNNGSVSSDSIVNHVFDGYGLFNVDLNAISTQGCESTISKMTEVFANPEVEFTALGLCEGEQTSFNDFSFAANTNISAWNWTLDFESLSSNKNTSHVFSAYGIYNVNLFVTSEQGCTNELSKKIEIYKLPTANFEIPETVCLGDEVEIYDLSDDNIIKWYYNFGDGNSSTKKNPTHTYGFINQFDISLEVTSSKGCVNDTTMPAIIEVNPIPIANFHANTLTASEIESEIRFYNKSEGATSYVWSFDNEDYSYEENPTYYFNNSQNYEVILTAINDFACSSEIMRIVYIHPEYTFFIPNSFTPNNDGKNDIFLAKGSGIVSSRMQVFDRWGGLVFKSSNIKDGWDGLDASANKVAAGIYMYHISLYDYNGKLWVYNGEFRLMR